VCIIIKQAWNLRNYRYVGDVSPSGPQHRRRMAAAAGLVVIGSGSDPSLGGHAGGCARGVEWGLDWRDFCGNNVETLLPLATLIDNSRQCRQHFALSSEDCLRASGLSHPQVLIKEITNHSIVSTGELWAEQKVPAMANNRACGDVALGMQRGGSGANWCGGFGVPSGRALETRTDSFVVHDDAF
jgi:hypothetical protein